MTGINLYANNAYNNTKTIDNVAKTINESQQAIEKQFKSYVQNTNNVNKITDSVIKSSIPLTDFSAASMILNELSDTAQSIKRQEEIAKKAVFNKASLVEMVESYSEAQVMLKTVTTMRDELMKAIEKFFNMTV